MRNKKLNYVISIAVLVIIGYNSLYFKNLSEIKASSSTKKFDAVVYAQKFWNEKLLPGLSEAIEISELQKQLNVNPEKTFQTYSHALGIGNISYFLVKGQGEVKFVNENDVTISVKSDSTQLLVQLATEFVYGNAVRDAMGLIQINEFSNTTDLNNVSAEINKKIQEEVIPPFKTKVQKGKKVEFVGALEMNRMNMNMENIEIIPISLIMN